MSTHHLRLPTPTACRCWPRLKVGLGHFSSLHFVVYLSLCEPNLSGLASQVNHNIDLLPACQRVRVHAGVLERTEGLKQGERQTHERLACCEDGGWRWPSKTLFTLCSASRKKPVQWKWNDPSRPAVMWHLCFPSLQSNQYVSQNLSQQHESNPLLIYFWLLALAWKLIHYGAIHTWQLWIIM